MTLKEHMLIGGVASITLYPALGFWNSLLFWISSFLIDADHFLDYLVKNKATNWSPKRMFRYYEKVDQHLKDPSMLAFSLLHTVEMFFVVYLLALLINYQFFIIIFCGMLFHVILDMINFASRKIFFIRPYSLVEYHVRKRNMHKKGLRPDQLFTKIFELSK